MDPDTLRNIDSPRSLIAALLTVACCLPALASAVQCPDEIDGFAGQTTAYSQAVRSCGRLPVAQTSDTSARLCVAVATLERDRSIADLKREQAWSPKQVEDSANRAAQSAHALARLRCGGLADEAACRVQAREAFHDQRAENRLRRQLARAEERSRDAQPARKAVGDATGAASRL